MLLGRKDQIECFISVESRRPNQAHWTLRPDQALRTWRARKSLFALKAKTWNALCSRCTSQPDRARRAERPLVTILCLSARDANETLDALCSGRTVSTRCACRPRCPYCACNSHRPGDSILAVETFKAR